MTELRDGSREDLEDVLALWARSGSPPSVTDSVESLAILVDHDPYALLLAFVDGALVASLIAVWNGWRGSFFRLAVDPGHRRHGIATALVREGEKRLRARGALRLDAIVASDDHAAMVLWQALGYERQEDRARFVRNLTEGWARRSCA
jgi:ribosomal protein S18 acetylase RimI-like enzyme